MQKEKECLDKNFRLPLLWSSSFSEGPSDQPFCNFLLFVNSMQVFCLLCISAGNSAILVNVFVLKLSPIQWTFRPLKQALQLCQGVQFLLRTFYCLLETFRSLCACPMNNISFIVTSHSCLVWSTGDCCWICRSLPISYDSLSNPSQSFKHHLGCVWRCEIC